MKKTERELIELIKPTLGHELEGQGRFTKCRSGNNRCYEPVVALIPSNSYNGYATTGELLWVPACKRHVASAKAKVTRRENKNAEYEAREEQLKLGRVLSAKREARAKVLVARFAELGVHADLTVAFGVRDKITFHESQAQELIERLELLESYEEAIDHNEREAEASS